MKRFALAVICCALATSALAAPKPCEELKAEIEENIRASGYTPTTVSIVDKADVHYQKLGVGSC
jgi:hypothetical protein